ncbi:type III-A CRISPR-associated protein Cas10/Csm1, partial [Candidatus Micrarchaeota archaeon]|nr:type III-A CRISPR-associated protein Cas10/Csm1 [Candidatus Micrarchaeota archaeon]
MIVRIGFSGIILQEWHMTKSFMESKMDDTTLKVALAGFMHDIGKLCHEGILEISLEFETNNAPLYQPLYKGGYSHRHALLTAAFIESMGDYLPVQLNASEWGDGDLFANLAAGHHKPETPLQWIISIADRLSGGWDRNSFDDYNDQIPWRDYNKTRLHPIMEHIDIREERSAITYGAAIHRYPLGPMSPELLFPRKSEDIEPKSLEWADQERQDLFRRFVNALPNLLHANENVGLWFEHFESLFMIFAGQLPAARAGDVVPDVSLYDHCRTTSALAVALYLFHSTHDSLNRESITDYDSNKFVLISGDFHGIQDFIFASHGETRRYRSKLLRGRSFAVSLISELAATMLCRSIGLPSISIVLNAAGKFTILAPSIPKTFEAIKTTEAEINRWLLDVSYGENSLGLSSIDASPNDFVSGRFRTLWDRLQKAQESKKYKRFDLNFNQGTFSQFLKQFNSDLERPLCPLCGKRPSHPELESAPLIQSAKSSCRVCRDHVYLGANLVKKNHLAVILKESAIHDPHNSLQEPIFGLYQVAFLDGDLSNLAKNAELVKYWDISPTVGLGEPSSITMKFINGYVPVYSEDDRHDPRITFDAENPFSQRDPKTLNHIASKARRPQ